MAGPGAPVCVCRLAHAATLCLAALQIECHILVQLHQTHKRLFQRLPSARHGAGCQGDGAGWMGQMWFSPWKTYSLLTRQAAASVGVVSSQRRLTATALGKKGRHKQVVKEGLR